jgi:Bacterial EndoU nuclease
MHIRILLLAFFVSVSSLLFADTGTTSRSKVSDLGRVIYNSDEALLLTKLQSFEAHTNVAVKIVTTFRLHKNFDVTVVYQTELTGDNTVVFVVQTGWWSTLTEDYEPGRFRDDLHADRAANLDKEHLLPAYTVEEIRRRMIERFYRAGHSEDSKNLYESLDLGIETLSGLIYNPVNVKGSLIWESLWNRPDPYITPELAGFIDGSYNTIKGMSELSDALNQATEVARTIAFNYTFNINGYRDAMHEMVSEVVTDLDTYIKIANTIVAAEDKLVNIYKGTTMEDRYWRGIIAFEVAGILFPLSKTKVAAKTATGLRGLLDDFRRIKVNGVVNGGGYAFKIITTDVGAALRNRVSHISKIVFEAKSNGTYRFSGCHSKSAIDELGANARIEITIPKNAEGVYEAKVFAKGPDGLEIGKSGNQGKSTFFPDSWSEAKILEEAEHAVKNNKGFANGVDAKEGYYGFSKDGKIKIQFYYRDSDGFIGSFFPKLD